MIVTLTTEGLVDVVHHRSFFTFDTLMQLFEVVSTAIDQGERWWRQSSLRGVAEAAATPSLTSLTN